MVQTMITDLPYDLLQKVMLFLAESSEGALHLARATIACTGFLKFRNDKRILSAANFDGLGLLRPNELYCCINGLIVKCAEAGNISARYMLAKVIMVTPHMWISYWTGKANKRHPFISQASSSKGSAVTLIHSELVRLFLRRCSPIDLFIMRAYLKKYLEFFVGSRGHHLSEFLDKINAMVEIFKDLLKMRQVGPLFENTRPDDMRRRLSQCLFKLGPFTFESAEVKMISPSASKIVELQRECEGVTAQLVPRMQRRMHTRVLKMAESLQSYPMEHCLSYRELLEKADPSTSRDLEKVRTRFEGLGNRFEGGRLQAISIFNLILPPTKTKRSPC